MREASVQAAVHPLNLGPAVASSCHHSICAYEATYPNLRRRSPGSPRPKPATALNSQAFASFWLLRLACVVVPKVQVVWNKEKTGSCGA